MKNVTQIIDIEIELMEGILATQGKHLISTDTLKRRCIDHFVIDTGNADTEYLASIGFAQAMQSRLYAHGYRSVRKGYFINFDRCEDINYLIAMYNNEDGDIRDKQKMLKQIKAKLDPQIKFTDINCELIIPMTEEEFMEKIMADAV